MSDLYKELIKLSYQDPSFREELLPVIVKHAKKTSGVPEWAEGEKFENPETGNKVLFQSLPSKVQKKLREQHKEKGSDKGKGKGKGKEPEEGEEKTKKDSPTKNKKLSGMADVAVDTAKVMAAGYLLKKAMGPISNAIENKLTSVEATSGVKKTLKHTAKVLGTKTWKEANREEKRKYAGKIAKNLAKGTAAAAARATNAVVQAGGITGAVSEKASDKAKAKVADALGGVGNKLFGQTTGAKAKGGQLAVKAATFVVGAAVSAAVVWGVKKLMEKHTAKIDKKIDETVTKIKKPIDTKIKKTLDIKTEEEGGTKSMVLAKEKGGDEILSGKEMSKSVENFMGNLTPEKVKFGKSLMGDDGLDPKKLKKLIEDMVVPD